MGHTVYFELKHNKNQKDEDQLCKARRNLLNSGACFFSFLKCNWPPLGVSWISKFSGKFECTTARY